jgi:DNA repair exonuclease SbcCD ATPase subunit
VEEHRKQKEELEASNTWAESLNARLTDAAQRIATLQEELSSQAAGYEQQLATINSELEARTQWAQEREAELDAQLAAVAADRDKQTADLVTCVAVLHATEEQLANATRNAESLESERDQLRGVLGGARESRWLRIGRALGVGPELPQR